ncbi:MAG TPA: hypothetical protein VFN35_28865, partial [Ktedonobacteraceae bacterium]|nr:hypothetical protein [Ktedonobacteraceae bacterium]
ALWNWWSKKFFWMDQIILAVVAIYYGLLQWTLGTRELAYFFPGLQLSTFSEVFLNFNGALICGLIIPFIQFSLRTYPRLKRLPLFFLSLIGAGMVYYLAAGITTPIGDASQAIYPLALTSTVSDVLRPDHLLTYGLLVGSLVLIFRLLRAPRLFTFLDHALLFFTALVCIQIQIFSWGNVPAALIPTIPFIGTHSIAFLLLLLFGLGGVAATFFLLFSLINQFSPLKQLRKRFFTPEQQEQGRETMQILGRAIERLLFCLLTLACMFQLLLYGQTVAEGDAKFIPYLGPVPRTDTIVEASLCLAAVITHLVFLKLPSDEKKLLKRPFDRFERFLLCLPLISCTLLYIQLSQTTFQVPLAFVLANWQLAAMQSPGTPFKFFMFCLMLLPLISLWWGTHGPFGGDRRLLQFIFGLGTIFGVFLGLTQIPFLAILTILTLLAGMVVATLTLPDNT